jgi:hypothetical protein
MRAVWLSETCRGLVARTRLRRIFTTLHAPLTGQPRELKFHSLELVAGFHQRNVGGGQVVDFVLCQQIDGRDWQQLASRNSGLSRNEAAEQEFLLKLLGDICGTSACLLAAGLSKYTGTIRRTTEPGHVPPPCGEFPSFSRGGPSRPDATIQSAEHPRSRAQRSSVSKSE